MDAPAPIFTKCTIIGPDRVARSGWEMRVNTGQSPLVVKDTNKQSLKATYERIFHEPPPSLHWRNVRTHNSKGLQQKTV